MHLYKQSHIGAEALDGALCVLNPHSKELMCLLQLYNQECITSKALDYASRVVALEMSKELKYLLQLHDKNMIQRSTRALCVLRPCIDVEDIPYKPKDEVYANPCCIPGSNNSIFKKDMLFHELWCMLGKSSTEAKHIKNILSIRLMLMMRVSLFNLNQ